MDVSQNQTECFGLHLWEAGDDFLREEFNENFEALDDAARMVCGSYIGNGANERQIMLDFIPKAVVLCDSYGTMRDISYYYGGVALEGGPSRAFEVSEGGFVIRYDQNNHCMTNNGGQIYYYLAFR